MQLVCKLEKKTEKLRQGTPTENLGALDQNLQQSGPRKRRTLQHLLRGQHLGRARNRIRAPKQQLTIRNRLLLVREQIRLQPLLPKQQQIQEPHYGEVPARLSET